MSQISRRPAGQTFRKRSNLAIASLSEALAPLLRAAAVLSSQRKPSSPAEWRRGVLLGATHIGDVLYNTASLKQLAEGLPNCEWHFVASPPAAEVLANDPYLKGCALSLESLSSVDVAICYNSGGYWRDLLRVAKAGIPNRVGYIHKGFSGLVTHPITIDYPQAYPAYFRDLVAQLTCRNPDWSLRPKVHLRKSDEIIANEFGEGLDKSSRQTVLACFLTSRQSTGVWPADKFAETIRIIEQYSDIRTILFGAPGDVDPLERLKSKWQLRAQVMAGRLQLLPLICVLSKCTAVLSTDSGPRHLANAAGVPAIYIRNTSFSKIEAGPYCDTEFDLAPDVEFVAPKDEARVFAALQPTEVARRVLSIIERVRVSERVVF